MVSHLTQTVPQTDDEYWSWFTLIIFLMIPVDMITTSFAIYAHGIEHEANPFMAVVFQSEWYVFLGVHLAGALLAITIFYGVLQMGKKTQEWLQPTYYLVMEIWMGFWLAFGLALYANNLLGIFAELSILEIFVYIIG